MIHFSTTDNQGRWSQWTSWYPCNNIENICNSGNRYRQRFCLTSHHAPCVGVYTESQDCPHENCRGK